VRSRRNLPSADDSDEEPFRNPLEAAIERERSRLWQAQAVLECLGLALLNADEFEGTPPNYSDAAKVAHHLIGETIEQLDSVNLNPLVRPRGPQLQKRD
jgi:hypothetical protein